MSLVYDPVETAVVNLMVPSDVLGVATGNLIEGVSSERTCL